MTPTNPVFVGAAPAGAVYLPAVAPEPPAALEAVIGSVRRQVRDALSGLSGPIIIVVSGEAAAVCAPTYASLASSGYPQVAAELNAAKSIAESLSSEQLPLSGVTQVDGDAGALALHVRSHTSCPTAIVTLNPREPVAAGLATAIAKAGVHVLVQGDLAATLTVNSPGYFVDGAQLWDERAVAAIRTCDVGLLSTLGPEQAERVVARGWAPLLLMAQIGRAMPRDRAEVEYASMRGVGLVVARLV
jgi:hypothetical protein